jgi:hypothetical protein
MLAKLKYECSSDYLKHRESILELHKKNSGRVSEKLYDSLYIANPYGEPLLGLCFDGKKLVGQENYIRQNVASNGLVYRSAIGINTIVDSNYRVFYGVFKELIKLTMNRMKENTDLLCAHANEESQRYYLKYFNWKIASKVQVYKKIIAYSGLSPESLLSLVKPGKVNKDFALIEVNQFDPKVLNEILENHLEFSRYCYFHKTAEFINWKFLNNKHYELKGYVIQYQGAVRGYVVTYDNGIELKIADFVIDRDDTNVFRMMISALAYMGSKRGKKRLVIYATPNCWYLETLNKQMFIRRWDLDFITASLNKEPNSQNWIIQIGDFDIL